MPPNPPNTHTHPLKNNVLLVLSVDWGSSLAIRRRRWLNDVRLEVSVEQMLRGRRGAMQGVSI